MAVCLALKMVIIFLTVLLFVQFSSQNAQGGNCHWPQEITANGDSFTISATQEALEQSIVFEGRSTYHCLTKVEFSSSTSHYYELQLSTHNTARKDCTEGYEPREYLEINSVNASRNGIQTCLTHLDRIIIQLPLTIAFISEVIPTTGFDIAFTRVSGPCSLSKVEATTDHKFLFSPLYDIFISPTSISCKVLVTVPENNMLFLVIRRNPSPSSSQCNGSFAISGTSSLERGLNELCGSGLKEMVLEPLNYTDGISFYFQREGNKYFSGFQLEYWAIKSVIQECRNLSSTILTVSSEAVAYKVQISLRSIQSGYCDFHLGGNGKALSIPFLSDVDYIELDILADETNLFRDCLWTPLKTIHAPRMPVRFRIQPCFHGRFQYENSSLIIVAVTEDVDFFPKVFYVASGFKYVWIPEDLTRKQELLSFSIRAGPGDNCFFFYKRLENESEPPLSSVANLFAGKGNTSFDFSRDCKNRAINDTVLISGTSSIVTIQIKRNINKSFWLAFQAQQVRQCPVKVTQLDAIDTVSGNLFQLVEDIFRKNMQCKWRIPASKDNVLKYRGQNQSPGSAVLTVTNATNGQLITFPVSSLSSWYYATSDVEVYAYVSRSLTAQEGFDFQFVREDISGENCPSNHSLSKLTAASLPRPITSQGYPLCYPSNSDCFWRITASTGMLVRIVIIDLKIESSSGCYADALDIFDGFNDSFPLLASICGQNLQNGAHIISSSSEVYMHFRSDSGICYKGFSLTYEQTEVNNQRCDRDPITLFADAAPTHLESPGYPNGYADNLQCSWIIKSSLDVVEIFVNDINLEEHLTCEYDYIEIYDGQDRSAERLVKLCIPPEGFESYKSTSDVALIYFHSDSHARGRGFQLSIQSKSNHVPTGSEDHSRNYSQTGAIVGGNIAATLAICSLIVGYICTLQRRRRTSSQHCQRNRCSSGTNSNSMRHTTNICVINPLIINTGRRCGLSSEPPPYPGLTNCSPEIVLSCQSITSPWHNASHSQEAPPEYSEIASTTEIIQPPAYSETSHVFTSDEQGDSLNTMETSNAQSDQRLLEGLDDNCDNVMENTELQDPPPGYEVTRQVQEESPPAYQPRPTSAHMIRRLGPL